MYLQILSICANFCTISVLQIADLHSLHRDLVPYVSWIKSLDLPPSNPKSIFGGIRSSSTSNAGKAGMKILTISEFSFGLVFVLQGSSKLANMYQPS